MSTESRYGDKIVRVVCGDELQSCTEQGWRVVDTYKDQSVEIHWLPDDTRFSMSEPCTKRRFVIAFDEESEVAKLRAGILEAENLSAGHLVTIKDLRMKIEQAEADEGIAREEKRHYKDMLKDLQESTAQTRDRAQKLEDALGAVRAELGDARMREIIGDQTD